MIREEKQCLRSAMRRIARARPAEARAADSRKIRAALEMWRPWREAAAVCLYHPLPDEPDILDPWPREKSLMFPRVEGTYLSMRRVDAAGDLAAGAFGILEPPAVAPAGTKADIIFVPGLAFDRTGSRLGRGNGFYDRLLSSQPGYRVGVCFGAQLVAQVPAEQHDERMDALVTPAGVVICARKNTR